MDQIQVIELSNGIIEPLRTPLDNIDFDNLCTNPIFSFDTPEHRTKWDNLINCNDYGNFPNCCLSVTLKCYNLL
jgi:hypothetical protein